MNDCTEGYIRTLERFAQEKRPSKPWVVLDRENVVRCASTNVSLLGYNAKDVRENPRPLREFIATDDYESSLGALAAYVDATLERTHVAPILYDRAMQFSRSHKKIQQRGIDSQLVRLSNAITKFVRDPSDDDSQRYPAKIRVKRPDGTGVTIDDEMLLVRYGQIGQKRYAGAAVMLDTHSGELSLSYKFKHALPSWELPKYDIHEKPLVIDSLFQEEDIRYFLSTKMMNIKNHEIPLVLDFQLATTVKPDFLKMMLITAKGFARAGLVVGNPSNEAYKVAYGLLGKEVKYARLSYHPTESYGVLNEKIKEGLDQLIERANAVSRKGLPEVQPNPKGQDNDVQTSR